MEIFKQPRLMLRQRVDCALQTDCGASLPRITSTQLIKHRKVKLVPTWSLHSNLFGVGIYSAGYGKRNMDTNLATKPLTYNLSCLKNMLCTELAGASNKHLI